MRDRTRYLSTARAAVTGIALGAFVFSPSLFADETPPLLEIKEWPVPWVGTLPRDPYMAPDGGVWFVGQVGNYVARLDPATGDMKRFEILGAGPHTVIVDAEGTPWYAGNRDRHIGRLNPTNGEVDVVEVPGRGMRPYGLVVDNDDRPWVAFMGSNAIGTVDPATMELAIHNTPDEGSRIRRIGVTSDGRIWWVDAARGHVGVYDPTTDTMNQWQSPGGDRSSLHAMAVDANDRVWYVEAGLNPNRFISFDSKTETFISIDKVPSGGRSVRHMVFDPETNAIWFGTDNHTIGRATAPAATR
jgi:virginiamycin B lyase